MYLYVPTTSGPALELVYCKHLNSRTLVSLYYYR